MITHTSPTVASIERIVGAIKELGWKVPDDLADAVKAARRKPNFDPVPNARLAFLNADTDAAYQRTSRALADAYAVQSAARSADYLRDLDVYRELALTAAFDANAEDLFSRVIDEYNACVPGFTAAFARLPVFEKDVKPVDLSADASIALGEAKKQAPRMNVLLALYGTLCQHETFDFGLDIANEWSGYDYASKIGDFDHWGQIQDAGLMLRRWSWRDDQTYGAYRELAPHGLVILAGGRLCLVHPSEADARQQRLLRAAFPTEVDDE